jgi:hypothetical protein
MWKNLLLLGVSMLPLHADAACTQKDLQGRYVSIAAVELSGFWQRCRVRINASGLTTGSCVSSTGEINLPADPLQLSVSPSCSVSGTSESGIFSASLKMQPHKRGLIGRIHYNDGVNVFEGPVVAVKRGR